MSGMSFGSLSDSGFGAVNLFGLDEFGQVTGMNPLYGAIAGAGFQTVGAIAARRLMTSVAMDKWSEAIGAGVGVAAGGVMMAFGNTRAAGVTAIATALVNGGLRQIETMMFAPAVAASAASQAAASAPVAGYFGAPVIEDGYGRTVGLGMVQAENRSDAVLGAPRVNVMGPPIADSGIAGPAAAQVGLMGGPALSGLGSHFGATLFSNG